ncbi:MAG: hypothetical protein ACR2HR_18190 [Euzebya sp.]
MVVLILIVLAVIAVAGMGAFAVALSRNGARRFAEQNEILPGVASTAPAEWAGSHSPEAKMHRRLGQAVKAMRAQGALHTEDVTHLELRVELEQHALACDRRLIAAAALPVGHREQALAQLEVSVSAIESATGDLATRLSQTGTSSDIMGLEDLTARIKGMTAEG